MDCAARRIFVLTGGRPVRRLPVRSRLRRVTLPRLRPHRQPRGPLVLLPAQTLPYPADLAATGLRPAA